MWWSLLPNVLRPFKIYCASQTIISQLVLFLWKIVEIDPLGHVRVVEALQNFVQKCDPVILSEIHIHIARCSTVSLTLRHLLHKGFMSFPILCKWPCRPRCPVSRPIITDSCCLLMLSSLIALLCWGPSMRALECLQSLTDFQHSMWFLSIQSPIARLTTLYGRHISR